MKSEHVWCECHLNLKKKKAQTRRRKGQAEQVRFSRWTDINQPHRGVCQCRLTEEEGTSRTGKCMKWRWVGNKDGLDNWGEAFVCSLKHKRALVQSPRRQSIISGVERNTKVRTACTLCSSETFLSQRHSFTGEMLCLTTRRDRWRELFRNQSWASWYDLVLCQHPGERKKRQMEWRHPALTVGQVL